VPDVTFLRAAATAVLALLAAVTAEIVAAWWEPAFSLPSGLMTLGAVALAGAVVALLARSARLAGALQAGPLLQRGNGWRGKSRCAACPRQADPDAAGHTRSRAPSAAPAAA
jgi:hypothetical protein